MRLSNSKNLPKKPQRKVSSADVARMAGVSQATVSYVLNDRPDQIIREETRRKVLDAVQSLGYQPNLAARTLATGKTRMIALWVPNSYHSVFNHVIEQIMGLAREAGFHVVIVQINTETRETLAESGLISGWNVDAILALDARDLVNDILDAHPGAPSIVSMGPAYSTRTDHVGVDLQGGSMQAVRHLVEIGCRRIASVGVQSKLHTGDPRYDAYVATLEKAGLQPELLPLQAGDYFANCYQLVRERFAQPNPPDGLFCWNDEAAIGANRALADLKLRVPDDVALIGSDGIRETAYAVPTLSTVAQPFDEMCRQAWDFLQRRIDEPRAPLQSLVLPMQLEKRTSTHKPDK
jgi:LacI family transcriptional regulator